MLTGAGLGAQEPKPPSVEDTQEAGGSSVDPPARRLVKWNEFEGPFFHGGDAVVSWLITGETRKYNTAGGYFLAVSPERTVFEGGPGAWEAVVRLSYVDLDDGPIQGGKFWRLTPMVNCYLSDHLRLELAYGIGRLDPFELLGTTRFFQTRLQFQF